MDRAGHRDVGTGGMLKQIGDSKGMRIVGKIGSYGQKFKILELGQFSVIIMENRLEDESIGYRTQRSVSVISTLRCQESNRE